MNAPHTSWPDTVNVQVNQMLDLHVVLEASCSSYLCFNGEVSCSSPPTRWCYLPIQQVTSPQKSRFLFISLSPLHEEMNVVLARDKNKTLVLQYYWPSTADRHDGAMFCPTGWRVAHVKTMKKRVSEVGTAAKHLNLIWEQNIEMLNLSVDWWQLVSGSVLLQNIIFRRYFYIYSFRKARSP